MKKTAAKKGCKPISSQKDKKSGRDRPRWPRLSLSKSPGRPGPTALFGFRRIWRRKLDCPEEIREGPVYVKPAKALRSKALFAWPLAGA